MGDGQKVNGQARTILAVSSVLSAQAIFPLDLRFYIKNLRKGSTLCKDDWLILGGLVHLEWMPILLSLSDLLTIY